MKANKAPKKIWIDNLDEGFWFESPAGNKSVEYVRADAFIEKACSWLKSHYMDYVHNPTGNRLEAFFGGDMCNDFEDYMKGE